MKKDPVSYYLISKPDYASLICPYCDTSIEIPYNEIDFKTDCWSDGAWVDCPECGKEIELGDYDYD